MFESNVIWGENIYLVNYSMKCCHFPYVNYLVLQLTRKPYLMYLKIKSSLIGLAMPVDTFSVLYNGRDKALISATTLGWFVRLTVSGVTASKTVRKDYIDCRVELHIALSILTNCHVPCHVPMSSSLTGPC